MALRTCSETWLSLPSVRVYTQTHDGVGMPAWFSTSTLVHSSFLATARLPSSLMHALSQRSPPKRYKVHKTLQTGKEEGEYNYKRPALAVAALDFFAGVLGMSSCNCSCSLCTWILARSSISRASFTDC